MSVVGTTKQQQAQDAWSAKNPQPESKPITLFHGSKKDGKSEVAEVSKTFTNVLTIDNTVEGWLQERADGGDKKAQEILDSGNKYMESQPYIQELFGSNDAVQFTNKGKNKKGDFPAEYFDTKEGRFYSTDAKHAKVAYATNDRSAKYKKPKEEVATPLTTEEYNAEKKKLDDEYAAEYDKLPDDVDSSELDAKFDDRYAALEKRKPKEAPKEEVKVDEPIAPEQKIKEVAPPQEGDIVELSGDRTAIFKDGEWVSAKSGVKAGFNTLKEIQEKLSNPPEQKVEAPIPDVKNIKVEDIKVGVTNGTRGWGDKSGEVTTKVNDIRSNYNSEEVTDSHIKGYPLSVNEKTGVNGNRVIDVVFGDKDHVGRNSVEVFTIEIPSDSKITKEDISDIVTTNRKNLSDKNRSQDFTHKKIIDAVKKDISEQSSASKKTAPIPDVPLEGEKKSWGDQAVEAYRKANPGANPEGAKSSGLSGDEKIIRAAANVAQEVWDATKSVAKAVKAFLAHLNEKYPAWYDKRKNTMKDFAVKHFTAIAAKEKDEANTTRGMLEQEKINAAEIEKLKAQHEKQLDRIGTFNTTLRDKMIAKQAKEMEALKKRQPYTQAQLDKAAKFEGAMAALGAEIFGKQEGRKEGVKEEKARQKEFADKISEVIKDAELNGEITARQAKALARRAAGVGTSKIKFDNFVKYAMKVVEDVEYDADVTEANKLKKAVKRVAHNSNLPFVKEFLAVKHDELPPVWLKAYNEALKDMAKKVPDYREAELILNNVKALSQVSPKQFDAVKTHADAQQKLIDIFANPVTDVSEYRELIGNVREFKKKVNDLFKNGAITDVEHQQLMDNIYDADGKVVAAIKDKVDALKDELIAEVRNTVYDHADFNEQELTLIKEFEKLKDADLKNVSAITLDNLVEVVDRMSRGALPATQLSDIVKDVVATRNSKPLLEQVQMSKIKGLSTEQILRKLLLEGSAYAQKILGVAKRDDIAKYIFSPISRALHSYKNTVDNLVKQYQEDLEKIKGGVVRSVKEFKNTHKEYRTAVNKVGMVMQILQERALKNIPVDERNVKMSPERAGERDNFGAMFGNQTELDNYTPAQQAMLRGMAKDFSKTNISLDKDGNVTGGLLKDIYDNLLINFGKDVTITNTATGVTTTGRILDVEAVYQDIQNGGNNIFTPKEKAVYDSYTKLRESLMRMQQMANAKSGKDFNPVEDYAMRYPLGSSKRKKNVSIDRLTSGDIDTVISSKSSTGEERTTNDAYAMETDIEALGLIGIKKSALHFNIVSANDIVNETIDKAVKDAYKNGDEHSAAILEALKQKKNEVIRQEFKTAKVGWFYSNLQKAKAISSLTETARAITEIVLTAPTTMMRMLGRKELREFNKIPNRKLMMKIMEDTNSSLLDKATWVGDRNYDMVGAQEAREKGVATQIAHAVNGAAEAIILPATWMPVFEANFRELTGREFNEYKYANDADYRKEFAQEIDDAASIADNRAALVFGTSNKGDERQLIQILPFINKNAVKTTSFGGMLFGFFANYPYRDTTALIHGVKQIWNEQNGGRAEGVRQSVGALMGIGAYGIMVGYARALLNSMIGSDDDKERAAEYFEAIKTGDYWKAEAIGTILQGIASRYSAGGRHATVLLLSAWREVADANGNKESVIAIDNILSTQFYTKPIRLEKYGGSETLSSVEMIVKISPAITYGLDMARDLKINVYDVVDKAVRGEKLSDDENEIFTILNLSLTTLNAVMAMKTGAQVPFSKNIKSFIKQDNSGGSQPSLPLNPKMQKIMNNIKKIENKAMAPAIKAQRNAAKLLNSTKNN